MDIHLDLDGEDLQPTPHHTVSSCDCDRQPLPVNQRHITQKQVIDDNSDESSQAGTDHDNSQRNSVAQSDEDVSEEDNDSAGMNEEVCAQSVHSICFWCSWEPPRWDDEANDDDEYRTQRRHSRATSSVSSYHSDLNVGALSEMDGDGEGDEEGDKELEPAPVKVSLV